MAQTPSEKGLGGHPKLLKVLAHIPGWAATLFLNSEKTKSPSHPPPVFLSVGIQLKSLPSCGSAMFSSAGAPRACTNHVQCTPQWLISFLIQCVLPACSRNTKPLAHKCQCASESLGQRTAGRLKVGQPEGSMGFADGNSGY